MEQQRKEEYTRKYIMHMLHLEKLGHIETEDNKSFRKKIEDSSKKRDERSFFCYGYYDQMTYIEDKEENPFTYEHAFSIKYPYKKSTCPIIADQLFTLLEPMEGACERENNPFLIKDETAPFLGVFLITISLLEKSEKENFCFIVDDWRRKLSMMLKRICGDKEIFQIYESPNCADLCLVIRTGELDKICEIERELENGEDVRDNSGKQGLRYTLYIASSEENALDKANPLEANKEQKIEIRFQCEENNQESLVNCLKAMANSEQGLIGQTSQIENYLVNGKGDYSLRMGYPLFAKVYPYYLAAKLGIQIDTDVADENVEWKRKLPDLLGKCAFAYERWYLHISQKNNNEDNNVKICSASNRDLGEDIPWKEICSKMQQSVEALKEYGGCLANDTKDEDDMICAERRFEEQRRMIRDLLYTYENLWFDKSTVPEGRIFYAQISALIEGIDQQISLIKEVQRDMKGAEGIATGRWDKENLLVIVNDLIENMYIMVSGINNFNRLIQAVNQNLRNVPNYEMHSKVNVEKYLYAYTMYLMNICKKYYSEEKRRKGRVGLSHERIFPIVIIGMSHGKISAQTLFRSLESSVNDKGRQSVFLVQCPNYHRFANIYHVLPMITHEISHCFRYEERKARNEFLIGYFVGAVVENLTDRLTEDEYQKNELYTWKGAVKFLCETIAKQMKRELKKALKKEIPKIHLRNMKTVCLDEIWKCLDAEEAYYTSGRKLWSICRHNFEKLYALCGIEYVTPEDMMNAPGECIYDALLNLLLDILNKDEHRLNEWEQWSKTVVTQDGETEPVKVEAWIVKQMYDIISRYQSKKVVFDQDLYYALQMFTKRMWKKFLSEDSDVYWRLVSGGCGEATKSINKIDKLIIGENPLIFDESSEFKKYFTEIQRALNWDDAEAESINRRIWEICLLAKEIFQAWTVYGKKSVCVPEERDEEFLEKVHKKLYDEYRKKWAKRKENPWIITKDVQKMYVSLGIENSSPKQFISRVKSTLDKLDRGQIAVVLRDKLRLYEEVFADLGMCKVFGFNAFGYFTYTIHLFMKERELAVRDVYDMSAERMKLVIYVLWMSLEQGDIEPEDIIKRKNICFEEWVSNYETEIKNCGSVLGTKKEGIGCDSSELKMHRRMLGWIKILKANMELPEWKENYRDFLDYAKRIYCEQMEFMKVDDLVVRRIGEHYNNFTKIGNGMTANGQNIMDVQNQFVLSYYGKMQDASANISTMNMEGKPGVDFAKQYNHKFMGWTGDE